MKKISFILLASFLTAGAYAQQGVDAVMEQQFKKDKEKSDKAITEEKSSAKAATWLSRAKTYQEIASKYLKLDSNAATVAYDAYKKAIELDTKDGKQGKAAKEAQEALKGQGLYAAMMQAGAAKYQNKNFKDATKLMAMAGEIMPQDTTASLYTAISAQQAGDRAIAKEQFERYINNGGKDPSVFYSLTSLYRQDKEVDKALATLDKGIKATNGNKDLAAERVNVMVQSGRTDEAIQGMLAMAEKDPGNANNWVFVGQLYDTQAQKTADELRKMTDGAKRGQTVTKRLAADKEALSAMQGELTRLNARAKKEPKNADVKRQIASVTQMIADKKTDIASTEEEVKNLGSSPAASEDQIAQLTKKQTSDRAKAMEYYQRAIQADANNYDANFNLGVMYYNEAAELNRTVGSMDMKEYQAKGKEVEGRVCGKFKKALPYFQKAKAVKDSEADLNEILANLENNIKQMEEKKVTCVTE